MADTSKTSELDHGAPMDYPEHERTYDLFLKMTKYGTIVCVAIMIGMAFGFFVGGWFTGLLAFIAVTVLGLIIL